MDTRKKRQAQKSIGVLLRWVMVSLLFVGTHALAQTGGTVTYVYTDPQGTPLAETDANGNITATFEYTPYGTYAPQGTSIPGPVPKGPGYTGHVNDPEINLVYMQARYYDPATGHFLSTDLIEPVPGDQLNFNRYVYAENNPIGRTDPTGDYAEGLSGQQINCEVYVHGDCGTKTKAGQGSNHGSSASGNWRPSGWQWLLLGFSQKLCSLGIEGACSEDPVDAEPLTPQTRSEANWNNGGLVLGAASMIPLLGEEGGASVESRVVSETLNGRGNFLSAHTLTADQALNGGLKWLGSGYKEIGQSGSGVFRSADGIRQFRMDNNSLLGLHEPGVPHVHFEIYAPNGRRPIVNNHVPFIDK